MKIEEWEVVKGQLPFFVFLLQQDKTAHHSPGTAADTLNLSYPQATKPYFMPEM